MNSIEVLLNRNAKDDHEKDGVQYFGFNILHPNGVPANVNFAHFCNVGLSTIFGKEFKPEDKNYKALFHFVPKSETDPLSDIPSATKVRRLYFVKTDGKARMFFRKGVPTELTFDDHDEPEVLNWICYSSVPDNEKFWFDFAATLLPDQ